MMNRFELDMFIADLIAEGYTDEEIVAILEGEEERENGYQR